MKILVNLIFTALLVSQLTAQEVTPPPPQPLTLAVLSFDASEDTLKGKATEVATLLSAQLSINADLWLVEREEMEKLLAEQTIALSGLTDAAGAAKAGKIIGAKVLVTGRLIRNGNGVILVAKIISSETSRVFGETATAADINVLDKPIEELSEKIGKLVKKQGDALAPRSATREQRIAKLKASLNGKPLPTLQVHVTELDLSRVVIDPAVETEFAKIILELGGQVVDPKQGGNSAEVSITGEAISQTGARRGQLVSARARVELKAIRASDNKVLAVDRETSVAVDISDAIAGKSALQNAAINLAERVLPALVKP
jgi:TolB-like protein